MKTTSENKKSYLKKMLETRSTMAVCILLKYVVYYYLIEWSKFSCVYVIISTLITYGLYYSISKSKIKLSWKQIIGADGYEIVRYNTKKKAYKKIKTLTNPKTVSYTDKGLKKRTKYKYKIRAYQKNGTKKVYGFYSNPKNGMTR